MSSQVYRTFPLLCTLVREVAIGTNLGLLHLLWAILSGHFLVSRGALIPAVNRLGLEPAAVRRSWQAFRQGAWTSDALVRCWTELVIGEGQWHPHCHDGWRPVAGDWTGFLRPRLQACPTTHYQAQMGRSVPAIPIGLIGPVGSVGTQRLVLPRRILRVDPADPSQKSQLRHLVRQAKGGLAPEEALVIDREFSLRLLVDEEVPAFVVRLPKNATARRDILPAWRGVGRRPVRGALVRPLARERKGTVLPATKPDTQVTWTEDGREMHARIWTDLVVSSVSLRARPDAQRVTICAITDPRFPDPLLLATSLAITPATALALYRDRWPIEQLPLAAKPILGAHRQFVSAPEACQRLPEVALLAGAILSYLAATDDPHPTGFWDRRPRATPGRYRRQLSTQAFPEVLLATEPRLRKKASPTAHLPKGHTGQTRRRRAGAARPRRRTLSEPASSPATISGN